MRGPASQLRETSMVFYQKTSSNLTVGARRPGMWSCSPASESRLS